MKIAFKLVVVSALGTAVATVHAGVIGKRDHESSANRSASVDIPLAPVLGRALSRADLPEARALQPCASGWPMDPAAGDAALHWVTQQIQAACVVSAAETALADRLTSRVWPNPHALQAAADAAAQRLNLRRIRAACPAPSSGSVVVVYGDEVKAQVGSRIAYSCGPEGVTIARDGATFFGGGAIDGRHYKVGLERGSSDQSSVGGAFLSP